MTTTTQTDSIARLKDEGLVRVKTAIATLPGNKGNKSVHPSTGARWCMRGVKLRSGEAVRLEHIKSGGGQLLTSVAALERFLAIVTAGSTTPVADTPVQPATTPSAKQRDAKRYHAALDDVLKPKQASASA